MSQINNQRVSNLTTIPPPSYQSIIDVLKEERISIHIERGSNMISMTRMFQNFGGKEPFNYTRTKRFKDLKKALDQRLNGAPQNNSPRIPVVKIVNGNMGGSWIHRDLAVDAAMWLSPRFGLAVGELVQRYLSGDISQVESLEAAERMQELVTSADDQRDAEWFQHRSEISKPAHKAMASATHKWFEIQTSIEACKSVYGMTPKELRENFEEGNIDRNRIKDHYPKDRLCMSSLFLMSATGIGEDVEKLKKLGNSFSNLSKDLGFQNEPKLIKMQVD